MSGQPIADCIFCKIVAGEIPCYKIYEDDNHLAFLDITQVNDGHTLLITKEHVRWIWEVKDKAAFHEAAAKIAKKMRVVTGQEQVVSLTIGEAVPHVHYHLLPQTDGVLNGVLDKWGEALTMRKKSAEEMEKIAAQFRLD